MTANRRILVWIAISTSAVFAAVLALGAIAGVRINIASNSLPPGFYRIVPAGNGRDLLICPTGIAESVSIGRGYRPKGAGCGDGYAPLLKPISARYGDTVTVSGSGIAINGRLLSNSKQYAKDALGRPLAHLKTMGRASRPISVNKWPDQATAPIANAAKAVAGAPLKEPEWICIAHPFIESNRAKVTAVEAEAVVRRDHPDGPW